MKKMLVIGLSGQVGDALLPLLREQKIPLLALSRSERVDDPGLQWLRGSLEDMPSLSADIDCILSLGPLDAFAVWFADSGVEGVRVVALSSTGRVDKSRSIDPAERELATRLQAAEAQLFAAGARRDCATTVLRPTLIYGGSRDRSLSRLVDLGRRFGIIALPSDATGLRQPVHVADVADALRRCIDAPGTEGQAFDLPGAEALAFDVMVRRALASQAPRCRLIMLPASLWRLGLAAVSLFARAPFNEGQLARLRRDQLADAGPARRAFGYAPRPFDP
ncbi:MAG: NAD(P)H-binding protein [Arenimonas sp.]